MSFIGQTIPAAASSKAMLIRPTTSKRAAVVSSRMNLLYWCCPRCVTVGSRCARNEKAMLKSGDRESLTRRKPGNANDCMIKYLSNYPEESKM